MFKNSRVRYNFNLIYGQSYWSFNNMTITEIRWTFLRWFQDLMITEERCSELNIALDRAIESMGVSQ